MDEGPPLFPEGPDRDLEGPRRGGVAHEGPRPYPPRGPPGRPPPAAPPGVAGPRPGGARDSQDHAVPETLPPARRRVPREALRREPFREDLPGVPGPVPP